ncbi:MAG: DUF362 domain-containing protein [Cyanobacteria bacterium P01_H01_bin.153]
MANFLPPNSTRRKLLQILGLAGGAAALPTFLRAWQHSSTPTPAASALALDDLPQATPLAAASLNPHRVVLISTTDRAAGVRQAIDLLQPPGFSGKRVFIKPNYNTGDPAPASTDPVVLEALVQEIQAAGASDITVGDRSGMADTRSAMQQQRVFQLANQYGFASLVFDELSRDNWQYFSGGGTNWSRGFAIAKPVLDADAIVNACCLKTHRFGGHFTLSLKNTIGMVAKYVPGDGYNYMRELHNSANQRLMIAEVNRTYRPSLIVIDGVDAFVNGGPAQGETVRAGVMLASTDRVAIDAVGIAVLRLLGTTQAVSAGSIWSQAQIRRAADLGLGAVSPDAIELLTSDSASVQMADRLRPFLV